MEQFPKYKYDERTGFWYELGEHDLYYLLDELPEVKYVSGKYSSMRKKYLQEHNRSYYMHLYMAGELEQHLEEVQQRVQRQVKQIVEHWAKIEGCEEELKMRDQMKWVGLMNNYHACAEEIVLRDVVFE